MPALDTTARDLLEIRQLIAAWAQALHARDADGLSAHYATGVRVFDVGPPLEHRGRSAYRALWAQCLPYFDGDISHQTRGLEIQVSGDLAFAHCLSRITDQAQTQPLPWVRTTLCLRRGEGGWEVVHEHASLPVDYASGTIASSAP